MSDPIPPSTGPEDAAPKRSLIRALISAIVRPIQHAAASAVGIDEEARVETVQQMLEFNARRAPGYWIQLGLASGIAILGLVLGSTAVVIGAMLISPLMGPIIELGMGFAVGSSFLVIRSFLRVLMSVAVVVVGTALFTMVLPFHEVTNEISSRTAPTALDLLVAVFCALTAAYTTVRRTSDTTAAAAGTAIGIALVPPLCVIGYGLGTWNMEIASGSALLLTANFSAILVFAVLSFLFLGYDTIDATAMEERFFTIRRTRVDRLAWRAETSLENMFGSRFGFAMRLVVPGLFLAAVYFPLTSALDQVTKRVRDRAAIQDIIEQEAPEAVERTVAVDRMSISVRLLIIGDAANAGDLERRLETRIAAETQIVPAVRVLAVPDAEALARATAVPEVVVPELAAVEEARSRLAGELTRAWPTAVSGLLAGWSLDLPPRGVPQVTVYHFGPRLGAAGEALLAGALAPALEVTPTIMDVPLDSMPIYSGRDPSEWFSFLSPSFALVPWLDQVIGCITQPATPTVDPAINSTADVADSVSALVARSEGRVDVAEGAGWAFAWTTGECRSPPASDNTVFVPGF